ncbi:MAG: hypothetical protein IIB13_06210 [Chloroflexi bacterium]|nr:hypothetical protein [Chloroflexota bacterium]
MLNFLRIQPEQEWFVDLPKPGGHLLTAECARVSIDERFDRIIKDDGQKEKFSKDLREKIPLGCGNEQLKMAFMTPDRV